jgi:hypothetical protein
MIKLLRGCVAVAGLALGLLVWAGCSDDEGGVGPNTGGGTPSTGGGDQTFTGDVRPDAVPVSYKEYSLEESPCEWKENRFAAKNNGTVVVINNNEALENYVGCIDGTYPAVDFSQKTLLVATGLEAYQNTPRIATLVKNPDGAYAMEVSMNVSDAPAPNFWQVSVVVDKIDGDSRISAVVQRDGTGDPIVKGCGNGDGLFKKNCGTPGSGLRSE